MAILELLGKNPGGMGLVEIAKALQVNNNAVFRICSALLQQGYLLRDEETRKFVLGRKLLTVALGAVHERNVVECAFDLLRAMRDELKETVALGTLLPESACGVVLASLDHLHGYGTRIGIGFQFELHCAAPGKAMLAFLPPDERQAICANLRFPRHTPHTLSCLKQLSGELETARQTGYALDREEYSMGIYCVAAPVFNSARYPVAAIWIGGLMDRFPAAGYEFLGQRIKHYADAISSRLA